MKCDIVLSILLVILSFFFPEEMQASLLENDFHNECCAEQDVWQYRYEGESLVKRISDNTFSETPSFVISTHLSIIENDTYTPLWQTSQSIRPRALAPEEDDIPPEGWKDPYETPVGDIPWCWMLLLMTIYIAVIYTAQSRIIIRTKPKVKPKVGMLL